MLFRSSSAAPEVTRTAELEGLIRAGHAARLAGDDYFDNPLLRATVPLDTEQQLLELAALTHAWWAGWLEADDGRSEHVNVLMRRTTLW